MYKNSIISTKCVSGIQFSVQSPEVRKLLSHVEVNDYSGIESGITKPQSLYDPKMGTALKHMRCSTCHHNEKYDCGHFGMIKFATPIFNILYIKHSLSVMACTCFKCGSFLIRDQRIVDEILLLPKRHRMSRCKNKISDKMKKCISCGYDNNLVSYDIVDGINIKLRKRVPKGKNKYKKTDEFIMSSVEAILDNFKKLRNQDIDVMGFDSKYARPEHFIMEDMLVPPITIRPCITSQEGNQRSESGLYKLLSAVVNTNNNLAKILGTKDIKNPDVYKFYETLLTTVGSLFTDKISSKKMGGILSSGSGKEVLSIMELYKGKHGYLRENLLGKRTDKNARTPIRADAMLMIDEFGVPEYICRNITTIETVNEYNIERLKSYVRAGVKGYPAAKRVSSSREHNDLYNRDNRYKSLIGNQKQLNDIADKLQYGDRVHRYLNDGDYVIVNRSPSLHKPSVLAFKIRVMPNTLAFGLPNCVTTPFNADFDGDEMTLHVVDKWESIAEMKEILLASKHIINPVNSNTMIAPIQDNVLGIYFITKNGEMPISKSYFLSLLGATCQYDVERVWEIESGFSSNGGFKLIHTLECITPKTFTLKRGRINIVNGKYNIDKPFDKGAIKLIIKTIFNNYDYETCKYFINRLQRLSDTYLMHRGYSIGIEDCTIPVEVKEKINRRLVKAQKDNYKILNDFDRDAVVVPITMNPREYFEELASATINACERDCSKILDEHLADLEKKGKPNGFMDMVHSKSKGSATNTNQILSHVGQQIADGQRIRQSYGKRSLPHFSKYDQTLGSRGFVSSSYADGLTPVECFMTSVATRDSLIDKSLKTSKTGYIGRRLVKLMESMIVQYDGTVRMYGRIVSHSFGGFNWDPTWLSKNHVSLHDMNIFDLIKKYY